MLDCGTQKGSENTVIDRFLSCTLYSNNDNNMQGGPKQ